MDEQQRKQWRQHLAHLPFTDFVEDDDVIDDDEVYLLFVSNDDVLRVSKLFNL